MRNFEILRRQLESETSTSGGTANPGEGPSESETSRQERIAAADAAIAAARSYVDRVKAIVNREHIDGARIIKANCINCSVSDDAIPRVTFSLDNRYDVLTDDGTVKRSVFSQSSYGVFDVIRHKSLFQGIVKDLENYPKLLTRILSGCSITCLLKDVAAGKAAKNPFSEKQVTYVAEHNSSWFFLLDIVPNERAKQLIDKVFFGEIDLSRFASAATPSAAPAPTSTEGDGGVPF